MSQTGIGSCAGNSSSVKGAREKSVLGQDSGRRGKTSTVATDFLPLIAWFIAELQRSEFSSFQHSYHIWFRQRNARSHPNRYLDQKVTDTEKQMQSDEHICQQNNFPRNIAKKRKVLFWRKFFKRRLASGYGLLWPVEFTFLCLQ